MKIIVIDCLDKLLDQKNDDIIEKIVNYGLYEKLIENLTLENQILGKVFSIIESFLDYEENISNFLIFHILLQNFAMEKIEYLVSNHSNTIIKQKALNLLSKIKDFVK